MQNNRVINNNDINKLEHSLCSSPINEINNSIEGGIFSHMKNMVSLHCGITKEKKLTLVDFYLMNLGRKQ